MRYWKIALREVIERFGGAGSGNFGHAGRPGEIGGSAPAGQAAGMRILVNGKQIEYDPNKETLEQARKRIENKEEQSAKDIAEIKEARRRAEAEEFERQRLEKLRKREAEEAQRNSQVVSAAKVSDRLQLPKASRGKTKETVDAISEAVDAIDSVNGIPASATLLPIELSSGEIRQGTFRTRGSFGAESAVGITVSTKGTHPAMNTAHEVGHFIDWSMKGEQGSRGFASEWRSSMGVGYDDWEKAVTSSRAISELKSLKTAKPYVEPNQAGLRGYYSVDRQYINYLTSSKEVWARSYAQYVAVRSGNKKMLSELKVMTADRKAEVAKSGGFYYATQWDDDDFEPIAAAIDKIFEARGLSRVGGKK